MPLRFSPFFGAILPAFIVLLVSPSFCSSFISTSSQSSLSPQTDLQFRSLNTILILKQNDSLAVSKYPNFCREKLFASHQKDPNSTVSFLKFLYRSSASPEVVYLADSRHRKTTYFGDYNGCLYNSRWNSTKHCFLTLRRKLPNYPFSVRFTVNNKTLPLKVNSNNFEYPSVISSLQVPYAFSVCLPDFCSNDDVRELALEQQFSKQQAQALQSEFHITVEGCQSNRRCCDDGDDGPPNNRKMPIFFKAIVKTLQNLCPITFLPLALCSIITISTLFDWLQQQSQKAFPYNGLLERLLSPSAIEFLKCFSLINNCQKLFNLKRSHPERDQNILENNNDNDDENGFTLKPIIKKNSENAATFLPSSSFRHETRNNRLIFDKQLGRNVTVPLKFLNGVRLLSILWIIISHSVSFTHIPNLMNISPFSNYPDDLLEISNNSWLVSAYLMSTYFPVSIFFMISGILIIYNQPNVKQRSRVSHCNVYKHLLQHIVNRLFRILPVFLFIIYLTYNLSCFGDGPLFTSSFVQPFIRQCKDQLWSHILFIHNWFPISDRCGSHTWFISADFQLHCLSFAIVHLLRCRSQWFRAFSLLFFLLFLFTIIPLFLVFFDFGEIPDFSLFIMPNVNRSATSLNLQLFYYATYMHAPAFMIGILLGYVLSSNWSFDIIQKNKFFRNSTSMISIGSLVLTPLLMKHWVFESSINKYWKAIIFECIAYTFHVALFWIFLIMSLNPRLLISRMFGAAILEPFTKCVYSLYLVHQPLIWFTVYQTRFPFSIDLYSLVSFTCTIVGLSIPLSFLLYLTVEAPFINVGKLLFGNKHENSSQNQAQMKHQQACHQNAENQQQQQQPSQFGSKLELSSL